MVFQDVLKAHFRFARRDMMLYTSIDVIYRDDTGSVSPPVSSTSTQKGRMTPAQALNFNNRRYHGNHMYCRQHDCICGRNG